MIRTVLVIDDEQQVRWVLSKALERAGYTVQSAESGAESLRLMGREPVDLVLIDLKLKGEDGLQVLRQIKARYPDVLPIILTAYGTVPGAVEAMRLGAVDVLRKPFDTEEVIGKLARALEQHAIRAELEQLRRERHAQQAFEDLIGLSPAWKQTIAQARLLAETDDDLLLVGEASTGRGAIGQSLHAVSSRSQSPLVKLDLHVYQEAAQLEALLGKHGMGGAWAQAGSGSLLLRGLDAAPQAQAALAEHLRLRPAGSGPRLMLIVDRGQQLPEALAAAVPARLAVPALRERAGDACLLAFHAAQGKHIDPQAIQLLEAYDWPGNVAELYATVVGAAQLAGQGPIEAAHLPRRIQAARDQMAGGIVSLPPQGISLVEVEQALIREALTRTNGNKSKAAALLGLPRHIFRTRLERYGFDAGVTEHSTEQDGEK